jgi:hypothetical protein
MTTENADDPAWGVKVEEQNGKWYVIAGDEIEAFISHDSADMYACMLIEQLRADANA